MRQVLPKSFPLALALCLGGVAMVVVAWLFSLLHKLHEEGNVHIEYALGSQAVVYIPIPGQKQGMGKITVNVQECSMEYNAITAGDALPTGRTVTVVDIIDAATVEGGGTGLINHNETRLEYMARRNRYFYGNRFYQFCNVDVRTLQTMPEQKHHGDFR